MVAPTADPLLTATPSGYSLDCHEETGVFAAGCNEFTYSGPGPLADVAFSNIGNLPVSFFRYSVNFGLTACSTGSFPIGQVVPAATTIIVPKAWFTNNSFRVSWPAGTVATDHVHWCFLQYTP